MPTPSTARSTFDPIEGKNYGKCGTCNLDIATEQDSDDHMAATANSVKTIHGQASHSITVHNPSREERIEQFVENLVEEAIREVSDKLYDMVQEGKFDTAEVLEGLNKYDDFRDDFADKILDEE